MRLMKYVKKLVYENCNKITDIETTLGIKEPLKWLKEFYTYSNKLF